mgnify:CR=1 FL=1
MADPGTTCLRRIEAILSLAHRPDNAMSVFPSRPAVATSCNLSFLIVLASLLVSPRRLSNQLISSLALSLRLTVLRGHRHGR